MGCRVSKVTVEQEIEIEGFKRQLEENDKVIADYRDLLRDKQIQPNAAKPPSYERSSGISGCFKLMSLINVYKCRFDSTRTKPLEK
jgi:hypothetical protein